MIREDGDCRTCIKGGTCDSALGADMFTELLEELKGLPNNDPERTILTC